MDFEFRDASFSNFKHFHASSISVSTASVLVHLSSESKLHILQKKKNHYCKQFYLTWTVFDPLDVQKNRTVINIKVNHCWTDALKSFIK